MKKFFLKTYLFLFPFILLFGIIVVVDPYEYFGYSKLIDAGLKKDIADPLNYTLGKMIKFSRDPCPNIILGDSRSNKFHPQRVIEEDYFNLSFAGVTLEEICKTFWWAEDLTELKNVYIGLNFNLYNMYKSGDRISGSSLIIQNPLFYLINRNVIDATFQTLKSILVDGSNNFKEQESLDINGDAFQIVENPGRSKDTSLNFENWGEIINRAARIYYSHYNYPAGLFTELQNISKYCNTKGIKLVFIIPPLYVPMQEKVRNFGLTEARRKFLSDLKTLGTVYDFNYPNKFTANRNNFIDPVHCTHSSIMVPIRQIWGKENGFGKVYMPCN